MSKTSYLLVLTVMIFGFIDISDAALYNRGGFTDSYGNTNYLVYDDVLDVTWYDYTRGADTWDNQNTWVNNLSIFSKGSAISGWRMPTTTDGPSVYGFTGTSTAGYNITSTTNELGYLYYSTLGNNGNFDISGNVPGQWGFKNTGPFHNLLSSGYWSGTDYAALSGSAWTFYLSNGYQVENSKTAYLYSVFLHDGDVAPIPIPGAIYLFGSALAGIMARKRIVDQRQV